MNIKSVITIDTPFLGKRWWRYVWQRRMKGFDDSETWNLDYKCAVWLLPRLKRFKELNIGCPPDLTPEKWDQYLDDMIYSLENIVNEDQWDIVENLKERKKLNKKVQHGLELLGKYFLHLWW